MQLIQNIIIFNIIIIAFSEIKKTEDKFVNNINIYNSKNILYQDYQIKETIDELLKNVEDLISNLIALSIDNATNTTIEPNDPETIKDAKICQESYSIFFDDDNGNIKNKKAKLYYLTLLYYASSRNKNDLSSYTECTESQNLPYKLLNLNFSEEEKKIFEIDSTYAILQIKEKKNSSFADIAYQENEFLLGLCIKKGCSEKVIKKIFYELNQEITFFDKFERDDIEVYDLGGYKINTAIYICCWIPFLILVIISLFSCIPFIPNILFSKMNSRRFNEIKECFNLRNNNEEIFGNPLENENIVSNDTGLSIVKGLRGLNMIAVLISTSFFYIFHLPTRIYNKDIFKEFITSFWFSIVYYGARFGVKILYAMSGFELVYKMLNYLDNCIENKEKLNISNNEKESLVKDYNIINDLDDDIDNCSLNHNNKKEKEDMVSLKEKKEEGKEEEGEEEEEDEDENDIEHVIGIIKNENKNENKNEKKIYMKKGKQKKEDIIKKYIKKDIKNEDPKENYFTDFDNIDLTNEAEIIKLENINKVLYKRHRNKLERNILFIFILKQWHKYMMFILAIFFFKYGVIQPFLVFQDPSPMWLIHLRQISGKFRLLHIISNIFCFSPFSYATYNEVDPFGMAYNEIVFFIIGSILIFLSYKYCLRLDLITIFLSIFFLFIKCGIGIYFLFFKSDNIDIKDKKEEHGFYPLMFFQYNEDNLKIKSYFFSNQFFNIPFFLLGIFFGEMNYSIQNFSKANDRNKNYLSLPKKVLNFLSRIKKMKILFFIISFILFALCVFTYYIIISNVHVEDPKQFFVNPWYNLVGLIDSDISVIFYFFCIIILLLSGDNNFVNFLRHKYWGIFSRTYWSFILCLHICASFIFYLSENRIKLIFYNVIFFSFEILMILVVAITFVYICVEIPLKKINKIFIKNRDEISYDYKNK